MRLCTKQGNVTRIGQNHYKSRTKTIYDTLSSFHLQVGQHKTEKKSSSNETSIKEKADHTYDCERCGLTLRLIKSRWTRSPFNCWIKWKRFWKREGIRWTVHKLSISAKFCSYEIVCLWRIRKQRNFKTDKLCNMLFLVIVVHGELPYTVRLS